MNNINPIKIPNYSHKEVDAIIIRLANHLFTKDVKQNLLLEDFERLITIFQKIKVHKKYQLKYNQKLYHAKNLLKMLQEKHVIGIYTQKEIQNSYKELFHFFVEIFLWIDEIMKSNLNR